MAINPDAEKKIREMSNKDLVEGLRNMATDLRSVAAATPVFTMMAMVADEAANRLDAGRPADRNGAR